MKTVKSCLYVRQLPNGQWVRCTRARDGKHTHPESQKGLAKAVVSNPANYRFVRQVSP